jgi:hypothetical protein
MTLQSTLDAIDAVTADVCAWCQITLTDESHSRDFCCQDHQARWQAAQVDVEPDPELLGDDVPPPMDAMSRYIATTLSQLPGTQVLTNARLFVNGVELPARNVRLGYHADRVIVDELQPSVVAAAFAARVHESVAQVARAFGLLWQDIVPAATEAIEQLAPRLTDTPPTEPRARALWLRQHRNTGPAPKRQRAPRSLRTTAQRGKR